MIRALLIEDEYLPAKRMTGLLRSVAPDIEILANPQTIRETVEWFSANPCPDLVFMDIHLADGLSFSIFAETEIKCPVIFTTAYDQYALKAFEVNSIDYLLKPITKEELERAVTKFRNLWKKGITEGADNSDILKKLAKVLSEGAPSYMKSFFISVRDTLVPVQVKDIAFFQTENKVVTATGLDGRNYTMDSSLEELGKQLDPADFFRANRQFIVSRNAVKNIATWFGNRVVVNLTVPSERIIISRTNVKDFKTWMTG